MNKFAVIEIVKGDLVCASIPEHFVYANRKGVFNKTTHTKVEVGKTLAGFPTDYLIGEYVVIHESVMDGHFHAVKLDNSELFITVYEGDSQDEHIAKYFVRPVGWERTDKKEEDEE